ncbi:MAG: hypothetical protein WC015_10640 [Methanoregula sp.]
MSEFRGFAVEQQFSLTEPPITDCLKIDTADYKSLACPEPQTTCYCCGKMGSWYMQAWS